MDKTLLETFGLVTHCTKITSDMIGKTFTRLTVLEIGKPANSYRYHAVCRCSCGKICKVRLDKLTSGHTQSCGCLQKDSITTHGMINHPLYGTWNRMMNRCYNPLDKRFSRYGGRGISVCERWHEMSNFFADMYGTYKSKLQLDRIDNNGNYTPENCKWSTHTEQQRNKSSNLRITIDGQTKVLSEWCIEYGIRYQLAWERITLQHWEAKRALETKPIKR